VPIKGSKIAAGKKIGDATKSKFAWSWKGEATTKVEFGQPTAVNSYRVCVYDSSNNIVFNLGIPVGGMCGDKPCWKDGKSGYSFKNKATTSTGVSALSLKAGIDGKASVKVKAKGSNLSMPTLALSTPVTAQLINSSDLTCWTATFNMAKTDPASQTKWAAKDNN